ncbi:MAG: hypothetical protein ACE5H7_07315 [Acidiferrobacterales bacterium]
MTDRYFARVVCLVLFIVLGMLAKVSIAADAKNYQVVDGVAIYFGIIAAEIIRGHSKEHAERKMHGGIPAGAHKDHLIIALFDRVTGKRITDAQVTVTVREIGLAGETKKLEPMEIADTITYGNYFDMPSRDTYRILIRIRRPGVPGEIEAGFMHKHFGK